MVCLAGVLLSPGCDSQESIQAVGCAFGEATAITQIDAPGFHDLALGEGPEGPVAFWSTEDGSFLSFLGPDGTAAASPQRLGAPCRGGMAAVGQQNGTVVACARPSTPDNGRPGHLALYRVSPGQGPVSLGQVSGLGESSFGVEMAASDSEDSPAASNRIAVGWQDASLATAQARTLVLSGAQRVDSGSASFQSSLLSSFQSRASAPSPFFLNSELVWAWSQSRWSAGGARGQLLTQREGQSPQPSLRLTGLETRVRASVGPEGPMVALEQQAAPSALSRSHAGIFDDALRIQQSALRSVGRSNSGAPMLLSCGGHVLHLTTRRSSREVIMVSIRRLGSELRSVEPEQQIYEYHARFPLVAGLCHEGQALLLIGEHRSEVQSRPRLWTRALRCGPAIAHERTPPP